MNQSFGANFSCAITLGIMAFLFIPLGCGAVGPPVPPEEVGIEAKMRKQRQDQIRQEGRSVEDGLIPPVEEPVELPELYPIDIR